MVDPGSFLLGEAIRDATAEVRSDGMVHRGTARHPPCQQMPAVAATPFAGPADIGSQPEASPGAGPNSLPWMSPCGSDGPRASRPSPSFAPNGCHGGRLGSPSYWPPCQARKSPSGPMGPADEQGLRSLSSVLTWAVGMALRHSFSHSTSDPSVTNRSEFDSCTHDTSKPDRWARVAFPAPCHCNPPP